MAETVPTIAAMFDRTNGHVTEGNRKVMSQLMRHAIAAGADIIVDQTLSTTREDGVFATIQAAIEAAGVGDRIALMPGTYVENLVFDAWTAAAKDGIVIYGAVPDTVTIAPSAGVAIAFTGVHDTAVLTLANLVVQGFAGSAPMTLAAGAGTTVVRVGYGVEIVGNTILTGGAAQIICNGAHFEIDTAGIAIGFGTALAGRICHVTGAALDASPL